MIYGDIRISAQRIHDLIEKELGLSQWIEMGLTGRKVRKPFTENEMVDERADYSIYDVAERAGLCLDDDLYEVALDAVRGYLQDNKEEIVGKINDAATAMFEEDKRSE